MITLNILTDDIGLIIMSLEEFKEASIKTEEGSIEMFNLKKKLLNKTPTDIDSHERDESERLQMATCIILLEVARSDDEFSSIEKTTIEAILKKDFKLSTEAIDKMMEIAKKKREQSTDLWEFTHIINENYSKEEKIKVVEKAWKVIYADRKLDGYEDDFIHRLAKLLQLNHSDLIEAKLKAKYEKG
jgi:uncharacterized tellurite resistance protein B-like protein